MVGLWVYSSGRAGLVVGIVRIVGIVVLLGPKRLKSILLACLSLPLTLFGPIRQHKGAIRSRGGSPKDKDLHMSASVSSWPTFKLEGIAKYFLFFTGRGIWRENMGLNIEHSVLSRLGLVSYSVLVKLNQDIYITNNEMIKCCLVLHPFGYFKILEMGNSRNSLSSWSLHSDCLIAALTFNFLCQNLSSNWHLYCDLGHIFSSQS